MQTITLGSTGIVAQRNGFGALPIQRDDKDTAVRLLRKAYEHGVNYYDTARGYTRGLLARSGDQPEDDEDGLYRRLPVP